MINRVLLYNSGGGIGDAIQILPLINGLKNEFSNANFFYLCAHENHFNSSLKDLNCHIESLELNVKYFGFRWWHTLVVKKEIKKNKIQMFDLIVDLQSKFRNSFILKMIPHKYFISPCLNFRFSKPSLGFKKMNKIHKSILQAVNNILNTNCELKDYDINKIEKKFVLESEKLLPKNNYVGFSITQGNVYRKKEWPLDNIVNVCIKLKEKNKIPVFFIEKKNKELKNKIQKLIPYSLFPEHESNIVSPALVTCLAKRLDFAITIDNGIMHMLALSKIPMISLFGPTDSEKFAPQHHESKVLDSKKIYNSKNVSDITVEDVLQVVKQFANF
tara:strand:+ start:1273 stop:2262 length:990 start_codon:yes stop_codon:yes gene_type:complete